VVLQVVCDGDKSEFVFGGDKKSLQIIGITAQALRKIMQEVSLVQVFSFHFILNIVYGNYSLCALLFW